MSRTTHRNFIKDDSSVITEHLRNHVHLTNCIHLKNHMHRHSPVVAGRSLTRDLLVLQRSRSLRDPSTSPPLWRTAIASSMERKQKEDLSLDGRRSIEIEAPRENSRISAISPWLQSTPKTKVASAKTSTNDQNTKGEDMMVETIFKGGSSRNCGKNILSSGNDKPQAASSIGKAKGRRKYNIKNDTCILSVPLRTLSEQLEEHPGIMDEGSAKHSHNGSHSRHARHDPSSKDPQTRDNSEFNGLTRAKRCNFNSEKRVQGLTNSRDTRVYNSGASNFLVHDSNGHGYCLRDQEDDEMEVTHTRNACGIPWNWSRIHRRGKTFLDKAGKSLSCGLSESTIRKDVRQTFQSQIDNAVPPDHSCSFSQSDSDALPLLNDDVCGSQESAEKPFLTRDYSGELGIFVSTNDQDSYSNFRLRNHRYRGRHKGRHECLAQKYMPKTFEDLVGQNLVVQALTNAIRRKRVGLIYVFYGPQGTGKSSCARIFARALNCQSLDVMKPCGTCISCISFDLEKNRNMLDVGPVWNFDMENTVEVFGSKQLTLFPLYKVFIVDDCDTLSSDSWSSISKVIDQAPRRVVFLFITSNLDHLPHILTSRCQKFFFPKLKNSDIIYKLQSVASREGLEIGEDALKLISSRSDGSLRDAEMTLDQLSLLRQRISLNLVQELVGLVSDEKVVDLLDLALCADTMNTIKSLREIMNAGVEPLALVSHLATVITDILAGSYVVTNERPQRKFFRRPMLSKEEIRKLRCALKTLSEAEKHLRVSNDKITWLTATLLQIAPDQQYTTPNSSGETSSSHSRLPLNYTTERELLSKPEMQDNLHSTGKDLSAASEDINGSKGNDCYTNKMSNYGNVSHSIETKQAQGEDFMDLGKIWMAVIDQIQISSLKHFMHQEGRLISLSFRSAPIVQLMFSSNINKSKAEKFRGYILQAFESVLCTGVILEFRTASPKDATLELQNPHYLAASASCSSQVIGMLGSSDVSSIWVGADNIRRLSKDKVVRRVGSVPSKQVPFGCHEKSKSEIIEILTSPTKIQQTVNCIQLGEKGYENGGIEETMASHHQSTMIPSSIRNDNSDQPRKRSLVRGKLSLAHVLQQADGRTLRSGWSRHKTISIAEKLEQENMKLEPKSRSLLCWKASNCARRKRPRNSKTNFKCVETIFPILNVLEESNGSQEGNTAAASGTNQNKEIKVFSEARLLWKMFMC